MRFIPALILALTLTACDTGDERAKGPVDVANLAPLSSREQALIFGADGAFQQGNYAAAERDYLSAAAESKGRVDAHLALARLYEHQHQDDKKRQILEEALVLQPNNPLANYLLGKYHLDTNHYTDALAAFQRGRITKPDDMDLTIGEAVAQDMLGKHPAAQSLYLGLVRTNPKADLSIVRTNLAMSYLLSDAPQRAVELLKDEASKPGASNVTRHNLALAYGLLGRHADAKNILNGEIDEETRQLAISRMQAYHRERLQDTLAPATLPLTPTITEVAPPAEPVMTGPAPVVNHAKEEKPAAKKAPKAKPAAAKPVVKEEKPAAPATEDKVPVVEETVAPAPTPKEEKPAAPATEDKVPVIEEKPAKAEPKTEPKKMELVPMEEQPEEHKFDEPQADPNYIEGLDATDAMDEGESFNHSSE